jgi:hypothetical protein
MCTPARMILSALTVLLLLPAVMLGSASISTAQAMPLYVAVNGTGTTCTAAAPCQLTSALSRARSADRVQMLSGNYPKVNLPVQAGTATAGAVNPENVVIEPAAGAAVTIAGLDTYESAHTWRNLTFTAAVMIRQPAVRVKLDTIRVEGAGAYIRGQDVSVVNSLFQNGHATDGLQIGQAKGVLVEGNTIRNYTQGGFEGYHSDCIQVFDSIGITIRGNFLSNCYNAALIFSPGAGRGTHNVLIESNFVQGCVADFCTGGVTLDMGATTENTNITLRNNTFAGDSTRVGALPGLVFDRNIVEYLSLCDSPMTNTIVMSWNRGLCAQPAAVGQNGTRTGTVDFANASTGDFHLVDPSQGRIAGAGLSAPAPRDYDGGVTAPLVAGADSPSSSVPVPSPAPDVQPDTVVPAVSVTSPGTGASVSGLVTLTAVATDSVGVAGVSFWVDNYRVGNATRQADGTWAATVDSRKYPNSRVTLRAKSVDAAGNEGTSAETPVRISN